MPHTNSHRIGIVWFIWVAPLFCYFFAKKCLSCAYKERSCSQYIPNRMYRPPYIHKLGSLNHQKRNTFAYFLPRFSKEFFTAIFLKHEMSKSSYPHSAFFLCSIISLQLRCVKNKKSFISLVLYFLAFCSLQNEWFLPRHNPCLSHSMTFSSDTTHRPKCVSLSLFVLILSELGFLILDIHIRLKI